MECVQDTSCVFISQKYDVFIKMNKLSWVGVNSNLQYDKTKEIYYYVEVCLINLNHFYLPPQHIYIHSGVKNTIISLSYL